MATRTTTILGMAVFDRSIECAQVRAVGDRAVVQSQATFALPAGAAWSAAEVGTLGQSLTSFLREHGFTASRVVAGLPAKWLIATEREVPPADEQQTRALLRLQAERLAVSDSGEVVFDYAAGNRNQISTTTQRALLVGVSRARLDAVSSLLDSAGLAVSAITSTGLAVASVFNRSASNSSEPLLLVSRSAAELVTRQSGSPRGLRHLSVPLNGHQLPSISVMGLELRRALTMTPTAAGGSEPSARALQVFDGVGIPVEEFKALTERSGVVPSSADARGALRLEQAEGSAAISAAAVVALAAVERKRLPLDFTHSRLAPPKQRRLTRQARWGIALATTALVALVSFYVSLSSERAELVQRQAQLSAIKPDLDAAKAFVDRVNYGRTYFETRPPMLERLRDLTLSIAPDERLWITSLSIRDNGKSQISGKAADQGTVLRVLDVMKKNSAAFSDVKLIDMREADPRSREVSFSISLDMRTAPTTATAGANGAAGKTE